MQRHCPASLSPEELAAFEVAFDGACAQLGIPADDPGREAVATLILHVANNGERDPAVLLQVAVEILRSKDH